MSTFKNEKFTIILLYEFLMENMYKKFAKSVEIMYNICKESDMSERINQ